MTLPLWLHLRSLLFRNHTELAPFDTYTVYWFKTLKLLLPLPLIFSDSFLFISVLSTLSIFYSEIIVFVDFTNKIKMKKHSLGWMLFNKRQPYELRKGVLTNMNLDNSLWQQVIYKTFDYLHQYNIALGTLQFLQEK